MLRRRVEDVTDQDNARIRKGRVSFCGSGHLLHITGRTEKMFQVWIEMVAGRWCKSKSLVKLKSSILSDHLCQHNFLSGENESCNTISSIIKKFSNKSGKYCFSWTELSKYLSFFSARNIFCSAISYSSWARNFWNCCFS